MSGLTGDSTARTPTAAQITALNSLKAAATSAQATYKAALASAQTAQAAMIEANKAVVNYQAFILGYRNLPCVVDGDPNA